MVCVIVMPKATQLKPFPFLLFPLTRHTAQVRVFLGWSTAYRPMLPCTQAVAVSLPKSSISRFRPDFAETFRPGSSSVPAASQGLYSDMTEPPDNVGGYPVALVPVAPGLWVLASIHPLLPTPTILLALGQPLLFLGNAQPVHPSPLNGEGLRYVPTAGTPHNNGWDLLRYVRGKVATFDLDGGLRYVGWRGYFRYVRGNSPNTPAMTFLRYVRGNPWHPNSDYRSPGYRDFCRLKAGGRSVPTRHHYLPGG